MHAAWGTDTVSLQDLTIGRGELWLNLFATGTDEGPGERYIGNTPGFTLTAKEDSVERKSSSKGLRSTTARYVTERSYSAVMVCDEMTKLNLALWFGNTSADQQIAATGGGPVIVDTFTVNREFGYQLGKTINPLGHRNVIAVVFKKAGVPITQPNNIALDATKGRFTVLANAPDLPNGTVITVEYKTSGYTRSAFAPLKELRGELRYIPYNMTGRNTDIFFPLISIEPNGALEMKTSDWQKLQFSLSIMKRPGFDLFYAGAHT
jgi:hypothetical protein